MINFNNVGRNLGRNIGLVAASLMLLSAAALAQSNPTQQEADRARNKPCRDPWINLAFEKGGLGTPVGAGDQGECDPKLYNSGSWSSFAQLSGAVRGARSAMSSQGVAWKFLVNKDNRNDVRLGLFTSNVVAAGGGNVVAAGGGNVIAVSGGNIVAQGGGNIVAQGGGNVITIGGANLNSLPQAQVMPRSSYSVMSGAKRVIKVGESNIVIR